MTLTPTRTTSLGCVLHADRANTYSISRELHHIIPVSWQRIWWLDTTLETVWDKRTMPCCPTGHDNLHQMLVRMMKIWEVRNKGKSQSLKLIDETAIMTKFALRNEGHVVNGQEYAAARLAMRRWHEAGGSLDFLIERKMYGRG